jgi:hypothetical protein
MWNHRTWEQFLPWANCLYRLSIFSHEHTILNIASFMARLFRNSYKSTASSLILHIMPILYWSFSIPAII